MKAFHNNPLTKEEYTNRLKDHYAADEIIQGTYWQKGKGCAVGCTVHSSNHLSYETELGIPQIIAMLEDEIFEWLPNELAKEFPLQFLSAINAGADLSKVWNYFAIWLLTDSEYGILQHLENKKVVQDVADAYLEDITTSVSIERWKELRDSASAYSAAAYYAAAYSAYYATAVADAADAADDAAYAYGSKEQWYTAASQKLIELLKEAN